MAQLIVRRLDEDLVRKLKLRAAANGRSAEAEHREILRQVLEPGAGQRSFKEALLEMPAVGRDEDFARAQDRGREVKL